MPFSLCTNLLRYTCHEQDSHCQRRGQWNIAWRRITYSFLKASPYFLITSILPMVKNAIPWCSKLPRFWWNICLYIFKYIDNIIRFGLDNICNKISLLSITTIILQKINFILDSCNYLHSNKFGGFYTFISPYPWPFQRLLLSNPPLKLWHGIWISSHRKSWCVILALISENCVSDRDSRKSTYLMVYRFTSHDDLHGCRSCGIIMNVPILRKHNPKSDIMFRMIIP